MSLLIGDLSYEQKNIESGISVYTTRADGVYFPGNRIWGALGSKGYHAGWALLMSLFIYAGSMQFVAIDLLTGMFNPLSAMLVTLMVNARHIFYGLSMLDKFKICGKLKPYMIFFTD